MCNAFVHVVIYSVYFFKAQKRESLVRLLYCHLLGYDVSFAYIHAVKLAQQGTILEKRVGRLHCIYINSKGLDSIYRMFYRFLGYHQSMLACDY